MTTPRQAETPSIVLRTYGLAGAGRHALPPLRPATDVSLRVGQAILLTTCLASTAMPQDCATNGLLQDINQNPLLADAFDPQLSGDGVFLCFRSASSQLVLGDSNGKGDAFRLDLATKAIRLVSVADDGTQANGHSAPTDISSDGHLVLFATWADNLEPGDPDTLTDYYVRDLVAGTTELVSVRLGSGPSLKGCQRGSMSPDGRYVVFECWDDNVVPGDTNGWMDVFLRDRLSGTTELISLNTQGVQGNAESMDPTVSADGRFVAFTSAQSNWYPTGFQFDTNIFVKDRLTGELHPVSTKADGSLAGGSNDPVISNDGTLVAYVTAGWNIVPGQMFSPSEVFVRDWRTGATDWASPSTTNGPGNHYIYNPALSADARFVVYDTWSSALTVQGGTDRKVMLHDRATRVTTLVSATPDGSPPDQSSQSPSISGDGRVIAYHSFASDLVPGTPLYTWHIFWRECEVATPQTYCWSKPHSLLCPPRLAFSGAPGSASGQPFEVRAEELPSQQVGQLLYGLRATQGLPFANGWLCIVPPLSTLRPTQTGGSATPDCTGSLLVDFDVWVASGQDPALVPGQAVYVQAWARDPGSSAGVCITDALAFVVEP